MESADIFTKVRMTTYNVDELRFLDHYVHPRCYVMDVMANLWKYYLNSCKMTTSEDISNPFEVTGRKTLAVENIIKKNMYFKILFFSQHYTHLHTCQKYHQTKQSNEELLPIMY